MGIAAAFAVPHPPLIVPAVGRGNERGIQATRDAYEEVARRVAALRPDTLVVSSPHAPLFRDRFYVSEGAALRGDMRQFGAPEAALEAAYDVELQAAIARLADATGVPVGGYPPEDALMDHATFVPLWFLRQLLPACKVVRVGLSGLPAEEHRELGRCIAEAATELDRRVVYIASGDLSHKLTAEGPYGFAPEGPVFDERCTALLAAGDLAGLFAFDDALLRGAAECGLGSFQIMAGALDGLTCTAELLSYEGPFGVGYAVAAFQVEDAIDPFVALARASVEHFVRTGAELPLPDDLPSDMTEHRAGVFVSLHEGGELRGCIGTIGPVTESIAREVVRNGIAACSQDPRFPAVLPDELDALSYSVDVLAPAEPIASSAELDVKRYGVIVTQGFKRSLLLPNLEGISTVEQQLAIAKQKAGISPADDDVQLERFEVVRHDRGGEARLD